MKSFTLKEKVTMSEAYFTEKLASSKMQSSINLSAETINSLIDQNILVKIDVEDMDKTSAVCVPVDGVKVEVNGISNYYGLIFLQATNKKWQLFKYENIINRNPKGNILKYLENNDCTWLTNFIYSSVKDSTVIMEFDNNTLNIFYKYKNRKIVNTILEDIKESDNYTIEKTQYIQFAKNTRDNNSSYESYWRDLKGLSKSELLGDIAFLKESDSLVINLSTFFEFYRKLEDAFANRLKYIKNYTKLEDIKSISSEEEKLVCIGKYSAEIGINSLRILNQLINDLIAPKYSPVQRILIGPPGSGKSYLLNNEELGNVTRVVFHPDYDNSDFVGSILPELVKNEKEETHIEYTFKKGPFTKIYKEAIDPKNTTKKYTLLIEEMTRGNCAAIFGEIFQLLDRDKNGYSEYPITNYNIDSRAIKLPPNLSIVGTVNSSDQNVFPMDTAFKRRFDLEYIEPINEDADDINILGVSWKTLCASINNLICNNQHLAEDKQIGFYFIKDGTLKDIQKLCIYLWHDVDKFIHDNDDKILNHSNCNNYATFNKKIKEDSSVTDLFNKLISSEFKNEEN